MTGFSKPYNPKETEGRIYALWLESGVFTPENLPGERKEPFSMVFPPPNVTGTLHMGHAATIAIEDALVRFWRMRGKKTLWLPGTDHAAIATQEKVERELYKREKKTRHDLGREEFLRRVEAFAQESHDIIVNQTKKMGASLDWSREAFTLDSKRSLAVRTAFKRMYDAGLIYRGERIVHWDPKMKTTVSDDEIEWKEEQAPFYYLQYGPFVIGTARPETKFGDKYVVMHPDDHRYKQYTHGENIEVEWINGTITATIIKDGHVDPEFGTGVMTITPWHDAADFDIAEYHSLEKEQIIDLDGKLLPIAGEFAGVHIAKARPAIVEKLKRKGLLKNIDEHYTHRIATNSRGGGVIEPQILKQWFVSVNSKFQIPNSKLKGISSGEETSLKDIIRTVVESGQVKIIPERFEKIYFHWINNLRDWCISRQIWYGHRIPVWYRGPETYCGAEPPPGEGWEQDPDTLDTWFSSGLWTFSTLGWPEETDDLATYHPASVLETGYDILFFWVARMILMSGFLLGGIPFKTVYLHGLVRDEQGEKMSKSLGNVIDPLVMAERYGADATRIALLVGNGPGNDFTVSESKIRGYRNFANKIWNASRFVLSHLENFDETTKPPLTERDEEILRELETLTEQVTSHLEEYRLYLAAEMLYHYFWHAFADTIIEETKPLLCEGAPQDKQRARWILYKVLSTSLILLHPFMPFITEEIWASLPMHNKKLLIVTEWPHH